MANFIEGKRIVITGGGGFIGVSLAERLVDSNEVVLFDQGFEPGPILYSAIRNHPSLDLVAGNVLDYDSLASYVTSADYVVHLAAVVGVNNVRRRVRETMTVNYNGTLNALRAAEEGGQCRRFLYFSTSEVFGINSFRVREESTSKFGHVSEARWCYSISKLAAEHLVWSACKESGIPTTIIRPFNIFGPKRVGDHAMMRFIVRALAKLPVEVHGDGSQIRSWCYIDDLLDVVEAALVLPEAVGEDFNVGNSRNTLTMYELAKRVIALTESPSRVRFSKPDFTDIDIRVPQSQKCLEKLGICPQMELDEALPRTINWYQEHLEDFVEYIRPEEKVATAAAKA